MNCLEFRRNKLAAPGDLPAAALEHLKSCASCAEFARSVDAFELDLEAAVKVPVEPTLAQRIVLNHKLKSGHRTRIYAMAASVVLALGVAIGVGYQTLAPDPDLVVASVDHVIGEPSAFQAREHVSDTDLQKALALSGGALRKSFGQAVSYLHDCPVPGGLGKHMVLLTDLGKVTLITMPNQRVNWTLKSKYKGLMTVVVPANRGSFAIVADSEQAVAAVESMLKEHVSWRT